jgi:hypothetical protein
VCVDVVDVVVTGAGFSSMNPGNCTKFANVIVMVAITA